MIENATSICAYDGTIVYVSRALAELLEYAPAEMVGRTFRHFVARVHIREIVHAWARLTAPGSEGGSVHVTLQTQSGEVFPAIMDVSPIPGRQEFVVIYKGVAQSRTQLAALNIVLTALTGTLKLTQVLDIILEQIMRVIPGEYSVLLLVKGQRLVPVRTHGHQADELRKRLGTDWFYLPNMRQVVETKRPFIINDCHHHPGWIRSEGNASIQSCIGIPILYNGQFCGVLEVCSTRKDAYTIADASAAQLFAQQAASAIRHAQLYRAAHTRTSHLKALNTIGLAVSRLDLTSIMQVVHISVASLMEADEFYIALYDQEFGTARLSYIVDQGQLLPDTEQMPMDGLVGYVIEQRKTLVIGDVQRDGYPSVVNHLGTVTRNIVIVPLIAQDEMVGALSVQSAAPDTYRPSHIRLLEAIASQTAVAIRNAQLYDVMAERAATLASLQNTHLRLSAQLDTRAILELIADEVVKLLVPDEIRIYLFTEYIPDYAEVNEQQLALALGRNVTVAAERDHEVRADYNPGDMPDAVIKHRMTIVISNQPGHKMLKSDTGQAVHTMIGHPIRHANHFYGAITLSYYHPYSFRQGHLQTLSLLMSQAATAIENARLYQEVRERAQRLAEANHELQALDHMRDELIQNVSHELRTPLAYVKGYAGLLRIGELGAVTPEQIDAITIIEHKTEMITRQIADIMALETISDKNTRRDPIDLNRLAAQAVAGAEVAHNNSRLCFQATLSEQPVLVLGDADRLNQVLDNLIGNAIKFSPEGGCIEVRTYVDGDTCLLCVTDVGIGIPADKLPYIFERFYQAEGGLRRRFGGAGLGLAIVKRIVEAHHGQIQVISQPGKGSTFRVSMPRLTPQSSSEEGMRP